MILLTHIYHPAVGNSSSTSVYCSGCCEREWSSITKINRMIKHFVIAIDHPEDASAYCVMNKEAKRLYEQDRAKYEATALQMVRKFAYPRPDSAVVSLKGAAKRMICTQLDFNCAQINRLPLSNSLKKYLDPTMDLA
ncbi:hypothetical protein I4U23_023171 [Adineta vaga]|nr:hypothetical protein I4U23_023171 [Adineta vaga]